MTWNKRNFTPVNKIEAKYGRSSVKVKVQRGPAFTLRRDLLYIDSILFHHHLLLILMDVASSTDSGNRDLLFPLLSVSDWWDWLFRKVGSRVFLSSVGGIFTRQMAPASVQGRRILCLVPFMIANTVDYDIMCLLNNIHHPLPWLHLIHCFDFMLMFAN